MRGSSRALLSTITAGLLPAAACLSNPTPHPAADGQGAGDTKNTLTGDGADQTTPGLDADATADDTTPPPASTFPPTDRVVLVRDARAVDLDGDDTDDVYVQSWPTVADARGVYVFFGRPDQRFEASDAFVATDVSPLGVARTALREPAASVRSWELTVLGTRMNGAVASLEVHPYDAGTRAFVAPLVRDTTVMGLVPDGGTPGLMYPVAMAATQRTDDAVPELFLGAGSAVVDLHPSAWRADAFTGSDFALLDPNPLWDNVLELVPIETGGANRWVAVWQEHGLVRYIPLDGSGPRMAAMVDVQLAGGMRGTLVSDLDGDRDAEIVGFLDDTLSVVTLEPPAAHRFVLELALPLVDLVIDDVAVADVDGSGAGDIVVLERVDDGPSGSRLIVVHDPTLADGRLDTLTVPSWIALPTSHTPRAVIAGAFGRGTEIWTFADDGSTMCHVWDDVEVALTTCPSP